MNAYVITNGLYYIARYNSKSFSPVSKLSMATGWMDKQKAENVLNISLPKMLRGRGYRVQMADCAPVQVVGMASKVITPDKQQELREEKLRSTEEVTAMIKEIDSAATSISRIGEMMKMCDAGEAHEDNVQQDLLHKIEFESCAKGNGAKLCSQLRKCRLRRRAYKDMKAFLLEIFSLPANAITPEFLESRRKELLSRVYMPRSTNVFN